MLKHSSKGNRVKGRKLLKYTLKGSNIVVDRGDVVLRNVDKGQAELPEAMMNDITKKHELIVFSAFVVCT